MLSSLLKKHPLPTWLLALFFFVLPLQTRLRFATEQVKLFGIGNNYGFWELYLSDVVLLVLVGVVLYERLRLQKTVPTKKWCRLLLLFSTFFLVTASLSITQGLYPLMGMYRWIKCFEMVLVMLFFSSVGWNYFNKELLLGAIISAATLQSVLAIVQSLLQRSPLFWLLRIVGQPRLHLYEDGISYIMLFGQRWIRAYGTFSHPNVLGAYLIFVLPLLWFAVKEYAPYRRLFSTALIINLLALLLSFSRIAWMGAAGFFLLLLWRYRSDERVQRVARKKNAWLLFLAVIALAIPLMVFRFASLFSSNAVSITERWSLNLAALSMIEHHPWLGVGIGNFVGVLRDYDVWGLTSKHLQPVHNIFLLVGAEIGLLGLVVFIALLGLSFYTVIRQLRNNRVPFPALSHYLLYCLILIVVLGQVDHYFWDIQQMVLVFAVVLGLVNREHHYEHHLS
ncbi:MAG: O-antigen ligase family protein [bacterium]